MASRKDNRGRVLQKNEYQRSNGLYRYDYKDVVGNTHSIYSDNLADLREKEKHITIARWSGFDLERGKSLTLNDVFDRYISSKIGLKESTLASYINMYDRYVRKEFGKRYIKQIKPSDLMSFYAYMLNELGVSFRSAGYIHMLISPTLQFAVDDGLILKNPAKGLISKVKKLTGYAAVKRHALTIEQQKAFMDYIDGHTDWGKYHSLFKVMLGTGLRVGELIGLRWEDVDFEKRSININHGVVMVKPVEGVSKAHLKISTPKTEAGIRIVPMMDSVIEGFKERYNYCRIKGFSEYELDGYRDFIFTKDNGTLFTCVRLDKVLRDIVNSYNRQEEAIAAKEEREPQFLPKFSCHILRHTFCTRLCEKDVNIKVIQEVMGHANIKITMDIYAEVSEEKKRSEIERLAKDLDVF